ncbi:hypothetical protein [Streptomyces sp.]|uniref:hypothetical protein n=1 Tax=Streptomyces sp. TaxID=1931 RepID=UPI002F40EF56
MYRARSHSSSVLRTLVLDEDGTWQPGTQLADDAMSDPVVAVHDARLHLAYRGFPKPGSTRPVTNYRIFDGARWSAATALPPADAQGFGLISYAGTLHCAYRAGVPGRAGRLLHSSFDGAAWSAPVVIHEGPGWGRPTLAVHDGKLYAAYSVRAEPSEPASFEDAGKGRSHGRMPQPTNEPVGQTQQEVTGVHRATDPDFRQDALIKYSSFDGTTWSVPTTVATGVRTPGEEIAPALTAYRDQDSGEETLLLLYPTVVEETAP